MNMYQSIYEISLNKVNNYIPNKMIILFMQFSVTLKLLKYKHMKTILI